MTEQVRPRRAGHPDGRRSAAAARRRAREQQIIQATRTLFDANGAGETQIEEIAQAVGINRAIVYRHFSGKEELFALTLVGYLDELRAALGAVDDDTSAADRLAAMISTFVDYGMAHPAFVDCAQTLMRRTGPDLLDQISESAIFRLGRALSGCLALLIGVLDAGVDSGEFAVDNPALLANTLYASGLGVLQLARLGLLITETAPGLPTVAELSTDQVRDFLVASALALARA